MTLEQPSASAGLINRVKNILLQPRAEWDRIAGESADVGKLYVGYALPLVALSAICAAIGGVVFGYGAFGVVYRLDPIVAVVTAIVQIVTYMVGVYVIAMVTNALAPTFGSVQDQGQAHKLTVYSFTAAFLAGVFAIIPALAVLGILGLYSFVLLYLGLPRLMKTPEDKRVGYFIALIVVGLVTFFILGAITAQIRMSMGGMGLGGPGVLGATSESASADVNIELPGGGSVNLGEIERLSETYASGGVAIAPAQLQALLPAELPGGFQRTALSSSSAGALGAGAEGTYVRGDAQILLNVLHSSAVGVLAAPCASGGQMSREDQDGYARMDSVEGRCVTEEANRVNGTVEYGVVGRNGASISAHGQNVSIDEVRAAVNAITVERIEALAQPAR